VRWFSGQDAFSSLIKQGTALSLSTLAFLVVFKGLAWSISLGNFRGGPTFPALFIGAVGGLLAAHLPGLSETPAVAVLMGAATVSILGLPLSATIITLLLTSKARNCHSPPDHRRRRGRLPHHPDAVPDPGPGRAHPSGHRPAIRRTLEQHHNGNPRRRSDMTTEHNPCRHRPAARDRAGHGAHRLADL
jgi:hypothetical protein